MNTSRYYALITLSIAMALIASLTPRTIIAGPPPRVDIPSVFPGEIVGSSSMRWVAPYVLLQEVTFQDEVTEKVTWYSVGGDVVKEITGRWIETSSYYILERKTDTTVIHSTHNLLSIDLLPQQSHRRRTIYGRDYGKYFYCQYSDILGTFTDFYASGSLLGTYGPHCWITGRNLNVSPSGSFAYTLDDSLSDGFCRIVSVDSTGNQVFSFSLDRSQIGITPSPTAELVVISSNSDRIGDTASTNLVCFFSSGETVRVDLSPSGGLVGWVPGTHSMIVSTSVGSDYTYHLLDWGSGDLTWSVPDPLEDTPMTNRYSMAISRDFFILSGLAIRESIAHGPVIPNRLRGTIRMLAAIDIKKGELAAKWYEPTFSGRWQISTGMPPMPNSGGRLIWYGDDLYHVTDVNFSKIDFSEIQNCENGWVSSTDSGRVYRNVMR